MLIDLPERYGEGPVVDRIYEYVIGRMQDVSSSLPRSAARR